MILPGENATWTFGTTHAAGPGAGAGENGWNGTGAGAFPRSVTRPQSAESKAAFIGGGMFGVAAGLAAMTGAGAGAGTGPAIWASQITRLMLSSMDLRNTF